MRRPSARRDRWLGWSTMVVLIVVWSVVTNLGWVDPITLPSPQSLFGAAATFVTQGYSQKSAAAHLWASIFRTFTGLLGGVALGIPIGLLMGYSSAVNAVLGPVFSFIRPVPPIAFIPLVILYFGIGEFSMVLLIGAAAFWYTVLNTSNGMRSVPADLILAALNLGVKKHQLLVHVMFPAALPHIMTGIKTATSLSWAIVVAAELVAAQAGMGYMVMDAATFFRIPYVYLGIAIIGTIGLLLETITIAVENRLLHWRGR